MDHENIYVRVEDKHGAVASVFVEPDNHHYVKYTDNTGTVFYTEEYTDTSIELIEQSVIDWAKGKRDLL